MTSTLKQENESGPLKGFRVIELAGIGPGPFAGQMLADMGAEVILVDRPGLDLPFVEKRGKRSIVVDLRKPDGADIVLRLCETADALIEGFRPGVAERLGVGPAECQSRNGALVYGRMTGWGQTGPWSTMAGHDINYLSITGALGAIGSEGEPPKIPLNMIGDYGGGSLFMAMGVLAAMLQASKTGKGDIVDAAIIDGTSALLGIIHSLASIGQWQPKRESNLLDGGAPFYRCYQTSDDRFMAVGAVEPQFFALLLTLLQVETSTFGDQNDRAVWPAQHRKLETIFASKTRNHWAALFDGKDACVTPVLDYLEAPDHPHNLARASHTKSGTLAHPAPAPRFASVSNACAAPLPVKASQTRSILSQIGYSDVQIAALIADGAAHST